MKSYLISLVKYLKPVYFTYFWIGTLFANLLKFIVLPEDNLILFVSFGGRKYDDSPRSIYEEMLDDHRFDGYKLVWAFNDPTGFDLPRGEKIKTDSLQYYLTALKARSWVTNTTVERGLNFKGRHTFYFNTWHGTPIKKLGSDIAGSSKSFSMKGEWGVDVMTAQSTYEADIFSKVFGLQLDKFLICGLPRNDSLANATEEKQRLMQQKIGLPEGKKVILYAPTYREYERDKNLNCVMDAPIDFTKWQEALGDGYVILLRAHYEVASVLTAKGAEGFVYDVSAYPVLNELMIASDMLISDYSSIYFDYSILDKPMICYAYDYAEYIEKRGLYFDIREELLGGSVSEQELLDLVKSVPDSESAERASKFRRKYLNSYGNATHLSVDRIYEEIQ